MKNNFIYFVIASVVIAGLNILGWNLTLEKDIQLAWVGLVLVFLNLALSWLVRRRNPHIAYIFLSSAFMIELLLFANYFWIQREGRAL